MERKNIQFREKIRIKEVSFTPKIPETQLRNMERTRTPRKITPMMSRLQRKEEICDFFSEQEKRKIEIKLGIENNFGGKI